jgi:membrane-associated phospholipid phosphatase
MDFHWPMVAILLAGCSVMLIAESLGLPVVLKLDFKGDLKRENRWFAQYGQAACTLTAGIAVWLMENHGWRYAVPLVLAPLLTGFWGGALKRVFGRVRPGHPGAGSFTGFSLQHANWRESFPSNHSAAAASLTVGLVYLYPNLAYLAWALAVYCALLRYLMDAHWPSDVLAGLAFGALCTPIVWFCTKHIFRYFGYAW